MTACAWASSEWMDADGAPKMTSFLVEDLDEVLELSD